MNAEFKINNPDKVEFSLKLTMPLSDWKKFKEQLNTSHYPQSYPTWTVLIQINDMISQANTKFFPIKPEPTEGDNKQ